MSCQTSLCALTALSLAFGPAAPAQSQALDSTQSVVSVTLLEGWRDPDGSHYAGIKIDLAPGWKTYWRAPGDGGIPTSASWAGSENLGQARIVWPRPVVFRTFGLRSVGYSDSVVLPVQLEAEDAGEIDAQLNLRLGVCNEICIPVDVSLSGRLANDRAQGVDEIRAALDAGPAAFEEARLSCTLTQTDGSYRLEVATNVPPLDGSAETSVIELSDKRIWVSEPHFLREDNWVYSQVKLVPQADDATPDLASLRMTLLTTTSAIEMSGCD